MPTRRELSNAIRALSMDAVQKAKSGHPGAPMGMADIAEVLWNDFLKFNPNSPDWIDRDRFVLSNGHGSMLLYSLLHLSGYSLTLEDLKNFRQLESKTPGHPECTDTPGVETTTGPLGQGLANAVGMAIAEKTLGEQFNRDNFKIIDHFTYVFMGDGCLMEGISHEACSLAGTLGLGKLIGFYDDNGISIDGEVEDWFTDDTVKRFESYGWQVIADVDGHDPDAIRGAIEVARGNKNQPTLICCKTIIGYGSPNKQGTENVHGAPLGEDEVAASREFLQWNSPAFSIPDEIYKAWNHEDEGAEAEQGWQRQFEAYKKAHPEQADEFERRISGQLPETWENDANEFVLATQEKAEKIASRKASQNCLNAFGPLLPELVGGSADLAASNLTLWQGSKGLSKLVSDGNYIYYGVREFAMSAIMNGIALHKGFIPYGATFLVFMDYAKNAVRMASLMQQRVIFVYTHDSIGLGEDGPTHQPVEHLAGLRMTPNMTTWRPCDTTESAVAWKSAIERDSGPTSLVFSRQGLPCMPRSGQKVSDIARGGYILKDSDGAPELILIATGSEVELAIQASEQLTEKGVQVRVVSMPSTDVFDSQDKEYKDAVLPSGVRARVAVEAAARDYWYKYVGLEGEIIGMDSFGASAPMKDLYQHFGITVEKIVEAAQKVL